MPVESGLASFAGETMGTTFTVRVRLGAGVRLEQASESVRTALDAVNRSMSTYDAESELSRLNRAPEGVRVGISHDLWNVLSLAEWVHGQTRGAFDVTVGPLVAAWGFGAAAASDPPDTSELEGLLKRVGMTHVELDEAERSALKRVPGVTIDLGAIAKGYGVDRAAEGLERLGIEHYMVEVGGEIRTRGRPEPDRRWVLGIEEPSPGARSVYGRLRIDTAALATSGDYRNFREIGDRRISHTLDPRTGRPVARRTASVSVVSRTAAEADALATALGVLPPDESLALAEERGWAVLLLLHDEKGFTPKMSSNFARLDFEFEARAPRG